MAIYDSFTIDYDLKTIRWTGPDTTIYTVNALYSWIMDTFDEQAQMDDEVPMSAQTPVEYTMINGWFIDAETTKYLKTGSIQTNSWTHPTNTTGIRKLTFASGGYTPCVAGDIGLPVVGAVTTDSGLLLHYDNTARKWWIRCDGADDLFDDNDEAISITGGTGAGTLNAVSATGAELWANIYTLGTIVAGTTIDVFQDREKLTAWWPAGQIDILVRIKEAGVEIDTGNLWIFARNWGNSFDFYTIDVTAGGRNAVPLATIVDTNNDTLVDTVANYNDIIVAFVNGTLDYDGGSGTGLAVNKVLWDDDSDATAIILAIDAIASGTLTLGNVEGTFWNEDDLAILAELSFNTQTGLFTVGQTVTGGATGHTAVIRRIIQDPQGDGTAGKLYVSGASGIFQNNENLTDPITGAAKATGTLTAAPSWVAAVNGSLTVTEEMNKDLENGDGDQPYNVIVECAEHSLSEVYEFLKFLTRTTSTNQMYRVESGVIVPIDGEQYDVAYDAYTPNKLAPFGSLSGVSIFGARGIYLENMDASDIRNFQLIDAEGDAQTPPNRQDVSVTGLEVGDQVAVFLLTGAGGDINMDMCGGCAATGAGVAYLDIAGSIPTDTPQTGSLHVYDDSEGTWQIYTYTSWSGVRFSGLSPNTVVAYTTSDNLYIPFIDVTADASTESVQIIQSSTRYVLIRVRKKGIQPFEIESTIGANGMSVAAIRTEDTIVT